MRFSYEKEKELNDLQRKEIEEHSRQRSMFFLNLAHEIKTPLTLISNYLEKYIEVKGNDEQLQIINQNIDKMKRNIVHFMNIEKLNKGVAIYEQNMPLSLSMWVKNKIELFQPYSQNKSIQLTSDVDSNIGVLADPTALDHILNNLLDNAIKYTPENRQIHVSVKRDNDLAIVCVADNGLGIADDQKEHIFEPFYQISHAKQNSQGLGMGLFIVKKLVESMNGKLLLESNIGKGSSFSVQLPYIEITDTDKVEYSFSSVSMGMPANKKEIDDSSYRTDRKTIFVVEDNVDLLFFLRNELSNLYNVYVAINGEAAMEKLMRIPKPDLIVSDIMMDMMDGYTLIEKIKEDNTLKDIPFIFLSAKSETTDRIEGLDLGAVDHISKPFSIKELLSKISSILANSTAIVESLKENAAKQIISNLTKPNRKGDDVQSLDIKMARYGITVREKDVFVLLQNGLKYEKIADTLFISERTVVRHVQNMYAKTNTNTRMDLLNSILLSKDK